MDTKMRLSDLVIENRSIIDQLIGTPIPSKTRLVQKQCQELFRIITQKDSDYFGSMSLLEQDIVMPIIALVGKVYDVPFDIDDFTNHIQEDVPSLPVSEESDGKVKKLLKNNSELASVTASGIVGASLYGIVSMSSSVLDHRPPFSWSGLFWGTLAAALVGKVVHRLLSDKKSSKQANLQSIKVTEYKLTKADIDRIVDNLSSFASAVDEVLAKYRNHVEVLQSEFSRKASHFALDQEYISVLECYQSVLGNLSEISSSPSAKDSIKQLIVSLQQQGYKAIHYSADNSALFELKEGDVVAPEEFKPAIVKISNGNEVLILKGGAIIPNNLEL